MVVSPARADRVELPVAGIALDLPPLADGGNWTARGHLGSPVPADALVWKDPAGAAVTLEVALLPQARDCEATLREVTGAGPAQGEAVAPFVGAALPGGQLLLCTRPWTERAGLLLIAVETEQRARLEPVLAAIARGVREPAVIAVDLGKHPAVVDRAAAPDGRIALPGTAETVPQRAGGGVWVAADSTAARIDRVLPRLPRLGIEVMQLEDSTDCDTALGQARDYFGQFGGELEDRTFDDAPRGYGSRGLGLALPDDARGAVLCALPTSSSKPVLVMVRSWPAQEGLGGSEVMLKQIAAAYGVYEPVTRHHGQGFAIDPYVRWGGFVSAVDGAERVDDTAATAVARASMRMFFGKPLSYVFGAHGELGLAWDLGVAYEANLTVLGFGVGQGRWRLALTQSVGFGGIIGAVPVTAQAPQELIVAIEPVVLRAATTFVNANARHDGSELAPWGDELELELTAYVREWAISALYRERMGARFLGLGFGVGIGFAE